MHRSVRRVGIAFVVAMMVRAAPLLSQQQRVATAALSGADSSQLVAAFMQVVNSERDRGGEGAGALPFSVQGRPANAWSERAVAAFTLAGVKNGRDATAPPLGLFIDSLRTGGDSVGVVTYWTNRCAIGARGTWGNVVLYTFVRSESGWRAAGKRTVAFDDLTCARTGLR